MEHPHVQKQLNIQFAFRCMIYIYTYTFRCIPESLYIYMCSGSSIKLYEISRGYAWTWKPFRPALSTLFSGLYPIPSIGTGIFTYMNSLMFMVFMYVNILDVPWILWIPTYLSFEGELYLSGVRAVAFNGQCNKRHHSAWMAQGIQGWLFCFEKPLNRNH